MNKEMVIPSIGLIELDNLRGILNESRISRNLKYFANSYADSVKRELDKLDKIEKIINERWQVRKYPNGYSIICNKIKQILGDDNES